jgi:hypothetical protein
VFPPEWNGGMRRYRFIHIAVSALITIIICFWVKRSVRVLRKGFITSEYQRREDSSRRCPLLHNLAFVTLLPQARSSGQTSCATSTAPPLILGRWRQTYWIFYSVFTDPCAGGGRSSYFRNEFETSTPQSKTRNPVFFTTSTFPPTPVRSYHSETLNRITYLISCTLLK